MEEYFDVLNEKGEKESILIKNRKAKNQINNELEGSKNKDKKIR